MNTYDFFRVPMSDEQFQACLEAAYMSDDQFVSKRLLDLALSFKNSSDQELKWRIEDEK